MNTPAAYTIAQFCEAYHISLRFYYVLRKQGNEPEEIRLGKRVIITHRNAQKWEDRMNSLQPFKGGFVAL